LIGLFAVASSLVDVNRVAADPLSSSSEMLDDAELTDIFFLDADRGWAVGDRGVVWCTEDGGRQWRLADSPVNCRLESIHFVDENHGWAVGGWSRPYTHKSSGVVMRTENGGRRWIALPQPTLPALKYVHFFDGKRGWAVGNASPMYPSGVFRTDDGGRSWTSVSGVHPRGWLSADFSDPENGFAVSYAGEAGRICARVINPEPIPLTLWQPLRAVNLRSGTGWAAGDGGTVLRMMSAGGGWQPVSLSLPDGIADKFDWKCVSAVGPHCWIAGAPGTRILHSADGGQTWELQATNQSLPLHHIQFLDERRGWVAGALGTILATRDGGLTWQRQKGQRTRAAILAICDELNRLPLELFTRCSGDEGYVGVAEIISHREFEAPVACEASWEDRAQAAVVAVGGSGAGSTWKFPLRQAGLEMPQTSVVEGWDILQGGQSTAHLESHIVRCVRQWRPDVVVICDAKPLTADKAGSLFRQISVGAVTKAADSEFGPELTTALGLDPWRTSKVLAACDGSEAGKITVETSRLATHLGSCLADYSAIPRGLLQRSWEASPAGLTYQVVSSELPLGTASQDIFSGMVLPSPSDSRREPCHQAATGLDTLSRMAQKRRNLQAMIARGNASEGGNVAWLAQVDDLTRELGPIAGGDLLFQLAEMYRSAGRPSLAADAMDLLVGRMPDHPFADKALLWLVLFYSSGEMEIYLHGETPSPAQYLANVAPSVNRAPAAKPIVRLAGTRADRAVALGQYLGQNRPTLSAEPSVQFSLAAIERRRSGGNPGSVYEGILRSSLPAAWIACAKGEQWLADGRGASPKPTLNCVMGKQRPRLDGKLDDEIWKNADAAKLSSPQGDDAAWPAEAKLARDGQFLYLAARCGKVPGRQYAANPGSRVRDSDLRAMDRIDFLLDVDRDYSTCYRLTVDSRGWAAEACQGDSHWDPNWFVASDQDENSWSIEAAIPLTELSPAIPASRDAWAIGIQRILPGVGIQGWAPNPSVQEIEPGEFGYLLFR
jgi:photosystem II stability/assembly factor-like uncharacterized protein